MKTTTWKRSAITTGLFLFTLAVLVTSLEAAAAMNVSGTGAGGGGTGASSSTLTKEDKAALVRHAQLDAVSATVASGTKVEEASIGGASSTPWLIAAVVGVMFLISGSLFWAMQRRRRVLRAAVGRDFCTLHPQDASCTA